jgi:hypothetical protein
MLLHVIASPHNVDLASDTTSRGQLFYRRFEVMDDPAVLPLGDFGNSVFRCSRRDPSGVVDLAPAGWIKGSTVESNCRSRAFGDVADLPFKLLQKRVVIVEAIGHASFI